LNCVTFAFSDLLANEFGEDERPEIMPDACYELLRHIADDLLDTRKRPEEIAEACECDVTRQKHGTVCRPCWQDKVKLYIESCGVACPFCGSGNIEGQQFDVQAGTASQPINCTDCGAEWSDVYTLDTISDVRQRPSRRRVNTCPRCLRRRAGYSTCNWDRSTKS